MGKKHESTLIQTAVEASARPLACEDTRFLWHRRGSECKKWTARCSTGRLQRLARATAGGRIRLAANRVAERPGGSELAAYLCRCAHRCTVDSHRARCRNSIGIRVRTEPEQPSIVGDEFGLERDRRRRREKFGS